MKAAVLAHQGGWDEFLLVLLPISLFAGLLAIANRRATREQAERNAQASADRAGQPDADPPPEATDTSDSD